MTFHDLIAQLIRYVPELQTLQNTPYESFYDEAERSLHVIFDQSHDADESMDIEPIEFIEGDVLIHKAKGVVVGFSILETDIGKVED